jgi:hypothetical protein
LQTQTRVGGFLETDYNSVIINHPLSSIPAKMGTSRALPFSLLLLSILLLEGAMCVPSSRKGTGKATEEEGRAYLESLESRYSTECNTQMTARWAYITNVTTQSADASVRNVHGYIYY